MVSVGPSTSTGVMFTNAGVDASAVLSCPLSDHSSVLAGNHSGPFHRKLFLTRCCVVSPRDVGLLDFHWCEHS